MDLKEAKEILDNCKKDDVVRYKEAQRVVAEAKEAKVSEASEASDESSDEASEKSVVE